MYDLWLGFNSLTNAPALVRPSAAAGESHDERGFRDQLDHWRIQDIHETMQFEASIHQSANTVVDSDSLASASANQDGSATDARNDDADDENQITPEEVASAVTDSGAHVGGDQRASPNTTTDNGAQTSDNDLTGGNGKRRITKPRLDNPSQQLGGTDPADGAGEANGSTENVRNEKAETLTESDKSRSAKLPRAEIGDDASLAIQRASNEAETVLVSDGGQEPSSDMHHGEMQTLVQTEAAEQLETSAATGRRARSALEKQESVTHAPGHDAVPATNGLSSIAPSLATEAATKAQELAILRGDESQATAPDMRNTGENPVHTHDRAVAPTLVSARQDELRQSTNHDHGLSELDRVRLVQRVARAFHSIGEDGGEMQLRLRPPELGSMRLEIAVRDGVMTAQFETETVAARNALLDNLPQLRDRLAEQNVKVERFDVNVRDDAQQRHDQPHENQPHLPRRSHRTARELDRAMSKVNVAQVVGARSGSDPSTGRLNVVI